MRSRNKTPCERLPAILTAFALAVAGVLALVYPWRIVMLYVSMMPVALTLLWVSRSVPAPADRIATVDAEHAMASPG